MITVRYLLCLLIVTILLSNVITTPIEENVKIEEPQKFNVEYEKYLQEVVKVLESDPEFKKKLENAHTDDIKTGKIAKEVEFLNHNVRRKLDELKRLELQRLEELVVEEQRRRNDPSFGRRKWRTQHNGGIDEFFQKLAHLDHRNPDSFEAKDLEKLIKVAVEELGKQDELEKQQFKQYEMEKQRVYEERLANMTEEQRIKAKKEHEEMLEKRKEHPKIHEPGTKEQLEDVWENQDHLPKEEFDPKVFFLTHDLNGDGFWDENEMKALLKAEVDKQFEGKNPDEYERQHELENMRRILEDHIDKDKNRMISFQEFHQWTKERDYMQDNGYKPEEEKEMYTKEEYHKYVEKRKDEAANGHHENQNDDMNFYPYRPEVDPNFYPDLPPPPQYYQGQGPPGPGNYPPGGPQPQYYQHPPPPQQAQYQAQPNYQQHPGQPQYQQNYNQEQHPGQPQYNQPMHNQQGLPPPSAQHPNQPAYNQPPQQQHHNNPPPPPPQQHYNNPPPSPQQHYSNSPPSPQQATYNHPNAIPNSQQGNPNVNHAINQQQQQQSPPVPHGGNQPKP